jgi:hypothetical protein
MKNTTFRKLDLFPSSGEGRHQLCWVPQNELTSITGEPMSQYTKAINTWDQVKSMRPNSILYKLRNCSKHAHAWNQVRQGFIITIQYFMTSYVILPDEGSVRAEIFWIGDRNLTILSWHKIGTQLWLLCWLIKKNVLIHTKNAFPKIINASHENSIHGYMKKKSLSYWNVTLIYDWHDEIKIILQNMHRQIERINLCIIGYKFIYWSLCQSV